MDVSEIKVMKADPRGGVQKTVEAWGILKNHIVPSIETLEKGDVFWEGDIVAVCDGSFYAAPESGIFISFDTKPREGGNNEYSKSSFTFARFVEGSSIEPPKGARPYFAMWDGSLKFERRSDKNGSVRWMKLEIAGRRVDVSRYQNWPYIVFEAEENGDYVRKGDLLFYYFIQEPTKQQVENFHAPSKIPSARDELLALKSEIAALRGERDELQTSIAETKSQAEEAAAQAIEEIVAEAETKQAAILESARQQRREAAELKKVAETEVSEATKSAEAIVGAAQQEADVHLKSIEDDASKLNLAAVVTQLYELQAQGELPELLERPAMRRLHVALGEMVSEAQGFAAPETVAQMENQNRMDEIKAMNYALAKQIRDAEADEFLPDVVRDRMIEQLLDMTEAKGGSIVKKAVEDG